MDASAKEKEVVGGVLVLALMAPSFHMLVIIILIGEYFSFQFDFLLRSVEFSYL